VLLGFGCESGQAFELYGSGTSLAQLQGITTLNGGYVSLSLRQDESLVCVIPNGTVFQVRGVHLRGVCHLLGSFCGGHSNPDHATLQAAAFGPLRNESVPLGDEELSLIHQSFPLVSVMLSPVRLGFAGIGDAVTLVGPSIALICRHCTLICEPISLVGCAVPFVRFAMTSDHGGSGECGLRRLSGGLSALSGSL
jgi:hypothetical protein